MTYSAAENRYESMPYRRVGRSGLRLPAISLGLWHNFGDDKPFEIQRAILRRAFDLGVTHFDLANNYGPPYGSAETNFGRHFQDDFKPYRDELIISSKAGYDMWPGPYGNWGSRKYLLASLDQSLTAHGPGLRGHLLQPPAGSRKRRSKRPWAPWTTPSAPARRSTPGFPPTPRSRPWRRPGS